MIPEKIRSIYLIAICGTGMASLAGLLKDSGFEVSGSDNHVYPPMSTLLQDRGIGILPGYRQENITGKIDLVVIGNAVSKTNTEVQAVLGRGIPYVSFPEALARFFLEGRKSLVVAGTHGKTTTTSLLSWILHHAGRRPGFMVGGWLNNFNSNFRVPEGGFFVTEGDEYDTAFFDKGPKFLHYRPYAAILTGVEFDHADIYRDLAHIHSAFGSFVQTIDPGGFLLAAHSSGAEGLLEQCPAEVETYGFSPSADWTIEDYRPSRANCFFQLSFRGGPVAGFHLPMVGRHNVLNAAASTAMALHLGLSPGEVEKAFQEFRGVKRRQEVVGIKNGITVIDDFAHHPTAIRLTLEGIRSAWPEGRLWAVFEPRSATSRRKVFQNTFPEAFGAADTVIIAGLFAPEKIKPGDRLNPEQLVEDIRKMGKEAFFIPETGAIVGRLRENARPGDVVVIMSSGGFGGIHQKLLDRL